MNFQLTPAVKNLLILNVLIYLGTYVCKASLGINLNDALGLHYYLSSNYGLWQYITFLFLHDGIAHVFFNMFAVFMFGRLIEQVWGTKRFLIYYFVTGIGSGIIQQVALYFEVAPFIAGVDAFLSNPTTAQLESFLMNKGAAFSAQSYAELQNFITQYNATVNTDSAQALALARNFLSEYQQLYIDSHVTIGASGAVFGLLLAFGMLFPNMIITLMFPPIPMKAKYFVMAYGAIELFSGVANFSFDNVAHWAHLGGMLFGFILIRRWKIDSIY